MRPAMPFAPPARLAAALLCLAVAGLAACSTGPGGPTGAPGPSAGATDVPPEVVAESLMVALRDADYAAAHAILATGSARDYAADAAALQSTIQSRGLSPESWSFEPIDYNVDDAGNDVIAGTVAFADGSTGTVEITLTALGLSNNPWRVQDFSLRKD